VQGIRRAMRKHYSGEDMIRIVLDGLPGEDSIAEPQNREDVKSHQGTTPLAAAAL
jgi:transposase